MNKIVCLTCDQVMPKVMRPAWATVWPSWHLPGCPDVGVIAANWENVGGEWYLRGTTKRYQRMTIRG